jgi:hypothetical protein
MTAQLDAEYRARLDFSQSWTGAAADPRCLLAPRASGWHPLLQAGVYCGIDGGDLTSTTRRARQLKARQREYVVNKALAHTPRQPLGGRGSGRHEG